jgi:hypothetical protein
MNRGSAYDVQESGGDGVHIDSDVRVGDIIKLGVGDGNDITSLALRWYCGDFQYGGTYGVLRMG